MLCMQTFYTQLMQVTVHEEMGVTPITRIVPSLNSKDEGYWSGLTRLRELSLEEITVLGGDQGWEAWG